ncbi:uncharacterized protein LOC134536169 isoform X2 [Bacillus rossius redtenbacheri]|uniref:uncharacterized protein LOC134536169 isoform X2 n=1 Tax=Bacillus rossius redtenbacheri TaxID=93214 RepID=UPI002FDCC613
MAPGAGGGGRPTGTVPKTKMYDPARDQRRDHGPPLNHFSNNLLGLDWQDAHYDRRTRKNSNRSFSDHCEPMDDGGSSHDNRCNSSSYTPDGCQWSSPGPAPPDTDAAVPAREHAHRNSIRDKSNISKTADRSEVVTRLNQICDYIKQTSCLMDTLKNSENSNLVELESTGSSTRGSVGVSPGSNLSPSRASSQGRRQSGSERDELRMKVEESQRKLQALQEHQAALAALQDKARQQLLEARQEQSALMVRCSADDAEEPLEDAVKLDQLQLRLQNLAEMCHDRNQLAVQLGEARAEEMLPEQLALQNKLQQLQSKKQHMDHLVSAPQAAAVAPDAAPARDKVAELSVMKQQLAHLKELVASVEHGKAGERGSEEQAVNLRRQNVHGGSTGDDLATDIHVRTQRLRDAQGRLQQLQELMTLVGDAHASGRPLPDHCLDALLQESSACPVRPGLGPDVTLDKNAALHKDLYPALREKKTNSQSQRQLLALELQAKRLELEALMSKDQGLPCAVNHDKTRSMDTGYVDGTTSTTWGSTTQDLADRSLCYSSDEGGEEEEDVEVCPSVQMRVRAQREPAPSREPLHMSLCLDSAPSTQPHTSGDGAARPSWLAPQDAASSKAVPPTSDYAPPSSTLSGGAPNNVWKPPHLQGDGWGVVYSPLPGDSYYQHLLATSQMQQQNMVFTMLNQCCQLLWLQQRDLQALRAAVHSLQERVSGAGPGTEPAEAARCGMAGYGLFLPAQDEAQLNNCFPSTPALNNQVPPGNRANNYWDNFRSYSRQNLLSTGASKSNEGPGAASHSPSPLVERSHNSLQGPALSLGAAALPVPPERPPSAGRKDKLNTDQTQRGRAVNQRAAGAASVATTAAVKKRRHPAPKITSLPPRNTHNGSAGAGVCYLRDDSSRPVHEEVTALISANESRPDFLLQLFRELRSLHSDPLRQSAPRSVLQPRQFSPLDVPAERVAAASAPPIDDVKVSDMKTCTPAADWMFSGLLVDKGPSAAGDRQEENGPVLPEPLPRNAAWKMKELLTVSPDLQLVSDTAGCLRWLAGDWSVPCVVLQLAQGQGHAHADWSVQSVVTELRPLLRAHYDDTCTPALLETLRCAVVRLLPEQCSDAYCCSQLDVLLRDAFLPFHHCRLGNVAEQLLVVVAEVLQGELSFLAQAGQLCRPPSPATVFTGEDASGVQHVGETHASPLLLDTARPGPVVGAAELCNGDLAEADQSCRAGCDTDASCDAEAAAVEEVGVSEASEETQALVNGHANSAPEHAQPATEAAGEEAELARADDQDWTSRDWTPPPPITPGAELP